MKRRKIFLFLSSIAALSAVGWLSYHYGRVQGWRQASIRYSTEAMGSAAKNALLVAKGDQQEFFKTSEEIFNELPNLLESINDTNGQKYNVDVIKHWIRGYYKNRKKPLPENLYHIIGSKVENED